MSEQDLATMEARIAQLEAMLGAPKAVAAPYVPTDPNFPNAVAEAEALVRLARRRDKMLGTPLLHEPGWQMLLDLFVRQAGHTSTCISSACIGSGAPAATGLRYIKAFEQKGWIIRTPDPNDARRVYLALSADLMDRMTSLLLTEWESPVLRD